MNILEFKAPKKPDLCIICKSPADHVAITSKRFKVIYLCEKHMKEIFDYEQKY